MSCIISLQTWLSARRRLKYIKLLHSHLTDFARHLLWRSCLKWVHLSVWNIGCHLHKDCRPQAINIKYSKDNQYFIRNETPGLLTEGLIEPSNSPWRAQVLLVKNEHSGKQRTESSTAELLIVSLNLTRIHFPVSKILLTNLSTTRFCQRLI